MNLRFSDMYSYNPEKPMTIGDVVETHVQGNYYESEKIDTLSYRLDSLISVVAFLASKLSAEDQIFLAKSFFYIPIEGWKAEDEL